MKNKKLLSATSSFKSFSIYNKKKKWHKEKKKCFLSEFNSKTYSAVFSFNINLQSQKVHSCRALKWWYYTTYNIYATLYNTQPYITSTLLWVFILNFSTCKYLSAIYNLYKHKTNITVNVAVLYSLNFHTRCWVENLFMCFLISPN